MSNWEVLKLRKVRNVRIIPVTLKIVIVWILTSFSCYKYPFIIVQYFTNYIDHAFMLMCSLACNIDACIEQKVWLKSHY